MRAAPRDRPSRSRSRFQWSLLTWRAAVPCSPEGTDKDHNNRRIPFPTKQSSYRRARRRGTGALQVTIEVSMVVIDLEGCSPLQPREPIKTTTVAVSLFRRNKFLSKSAAPRDRRPPDHDRGFNGRY